MAAPTYATDLTTLVDFETAPNSIAEPGSPWADGRSPDDADTDFPIQSSTHASLTMNTTGKAGIVATQDSYTWTSGDYMFGWIIWLAPGAIATQASGGLVMICGSSATNAKVFYVGGSDFGSYPYGGWQNFAVDPTGTADETIGTPGTTYQTVGAGANVLSQVSKGNPLGFDVFRYGRGEMRVALGDGTTPATFSGMATANDASAARWGLFQEVGGGYLYKGLMILGYVSAVDFVDSGKNITIDNTEFVSSDFNAIEIRQATSSVDWTNISINSLSTTSPGSFTVVDNATVSMEGCVFSNMGDFDLLSNTTATNCTWTNCGQITPAGADLTGSTVQGYEGTADTGALVYNETADPDGELDGMSFTKGTAATHAIEFGTSAPTSITLRDVTFSGYGADETSSSAVSFARTSGTTTLNIVGGTTPTVDTETGHTVNIVANPVTATVKATTTAGVAIQNVRVLLEAGSGVGDLPYLDSVTLSGSGTVMTVTHTAHGLATNKKVHIRGSTTEEVNGIKTITVVNANSYTYSSTTSGVPGGTHTSTGVVLEGLTDVNGEISDTRAYTLDQPVTGVARKGSVAPFYKSAPINGTIDASTGFNATVPMVFDGGQLVATVPDAPTTLVAVVQDGSADLTWSVPYDGGSAITDYLIDYRTTVPGSWTLFADGTSTSPSATVTGLTNGTEYEFRVAAVNGEGTSAESDTSNAVTIGTPNEPTGLTPTPGDAEVALSWTAPSDTNGSAITDYAIEYKPSGGAWTRFHHLASTAVTDTVDLEEDEQVTDAFTYADGDLNNQTNWTADTSIDVASNEAKSAAETAIQATNSVALTGTLTNVYSQLTVTTIAGTGTQKAVNLEVRRLSNNTSTTDRMAYFRYEHNTGNYVLKYRDSGGVEQTVTTTAGTAPTAPYVMRLEAVGTTYTGYVDGEEVVTGTISEAALPHTYTYTGWHTFQATNTTVDDFSAGILEPLTNDTSYDFRVAGINARGVGEFSTTATSTPEASSVPSAPLSFTASQGTDLKHTLVGEHGAIAEVEPSTQISPVIPSGADSNSLFICEITADLTGNAISSYPTGWAELISPVNIGDIETHYAYAWGTGGSGANDPGDSVTFTMDTSQFYSAKITEIKNAKATSPLRTSATASNNNTTSITSASFTVNDGDLITVSHYQDLGSGNSTPNYTVTSSAARSWTQAFTDTGTSATHGIGMNYGFPGSGSFTFTSTSAYADDNSLVTMAWQSDGIAELSWSAPSSSGSSAITDYKIEFKTTVAGTWTEFTDSVSTSLSRTIDDLDTGTSYDFRVAAINSQGQGPWSTTATLTPNVPPAVVEVGEVGTDGTTASGTSLSLTIPANGGTTTSVYLAFIFAENPAVTLNSAPTGWSQVGTTQTTSDARTWVYWCQGTTASTNDPGDSVSFGFDTTDRYSGYIIEAVHANTTTPIGTTTHKVADTAATSITSDSMTATGSTLTFVHGAQDLTTSQTPNFAVSSSPTTTWTEHKEVVHPVPGEHASVVATAVPDSGSTTFTVTSDISDDWTMHVFEVDPA